MYFIQIIYMIIHELLSRIYAPFFDFPLIFYRTELPVKPQMTSSVNRVPRKTVAIVGTGSAGIGALWALNRTHHDVYVYEAADRLGGHTNTVTWKRGKYQALVDTGFIALNAATYPNFNNFLKKVGVKTAKTDMTFGISRDHGKLEWSGAGLDAVFCQRKNLLSPRMWRMLFDVIRFNQFALDLLRDEGDSLSETETIGQYLEREGYSDTFKNDYLIPMTAALWSTSPSKCSLEFPATTLVRFMWNHHLLDTISKKPDWLTIEGGAKSYIDAVIKGFPPNHLFLDTPVKHVTNESDGRVRLHLENGRSAVYDHVILACHGDQAYQIIGPSATPEEKSIMSTFKTSENTAVLHSDLTHLPVRKNAWSALNYMTLTDPWTRQDIDRVSLTYNMNVLQHIPRQPFGDVLVTLNPIHEPKKNLVQGRYSYASPLYNPATIRAQNQLRRIQNKRGISYAGAWTKYGFHEDGFSSGLYVAQAHLGAKLPFEFVDSTYSRGKQPNRGLRALLVRVIILVVQVLVIGVLEAVVERIKPKVTSKKVNGEWKDIAALPAVPRDLEMGLQLLSPRATAAVATTIPGQGGAAECIEQCRPQEQGRLVAAPEPERGGGYGKIEGICQTTGWGGQPVRAPGHGPGGDEVDASTRLVPVEGAKRIRVTFNASVSDILPWKFTPQQREVRVLPGETALAFYTATNTSDKDIIGVATYSVTPAQTAPYFSKIQCFCFEEQRLNAGETVDMPVFFYLDPDLLNDLNMKGVETVTLSYTFFKAKYDHNGNFQNITPSTS
ncbi:hypothetical protein TruAng_003849 [Truncatella angustata]|nr:hypothetical protein TruAng_003849 [Truncatella angustata]